MKLSIIIPIYNEDQSLSRTLSECLAYLHSHVDVFELICIDDGSKDKSIEIVSEYVKKDPRIKLICHELNMGKGGAIRTGIAEAKYPVCLFMDADYSTPINALDQFIPHFRDGASVVIASRHLKTSQIKKPQPISRRILGAGYRWICQRFFSLPLSDFNCGFKAYQTDIAKKVYDQTKMCDWTFDVEVFCILKEMNIPVVEVPVQWEHNHKESHIKPIQTAIKTFKSLIQLKKRFVKS